METLVDYIKKEVTYHSKVSAMSLKYDFLFFDFIFPFKSPRFFSFIMASKSTTLDF